MSDTSPGHESDTQSHSFPRYGSSVELRIVDHPLVAHKLTVLRDETTDSPTFRRLTEELAAEFGTGIYPAAEIGIPPPVV